MRASSLLFGLGGVLVAVAACGAGFPAASPVIPFESNQGQAPAEVRYLARFPGQLVVLTGSAIELAVGGVRHRVGIRFTAAAPLDWRGRHPLPGRSHYFRGQDRKLWITGVPHYREARAESVWKGIETVCYGSRGRLEFDFIVEPGADPSRIRFRLEGAQGLRLTDEGDLLIETPAGPLRQHRPVAYQPAPDGRKFVDAAFRVSAGNAVAIQVGPYDPARKLIIDPVITFSTFWGGAGMDEALAIATDAQGNIYIAGRTDSQDLPTTQNTVQPQYASTGFPGDAFVTKFSPDGKQVLFSTYLGGTDSDLARAVAIGPEGDIYVAGDSESRDFPTTPGAYQGFNSSLGLTSDGFVARLSADGSQLVYSTYLGGVFTDRVYGLAVDAAGSAYAGGSSDSDDFPTTPGVFRAACRGTGLGGFVTKLAPDGTGLVYSGRVCGSANDEVLALAVDAAGNAYAGGVTGSDDFPVTGGALQEQFGDGVEDAFLAKISADGAALVWATYLGGSGPDAVRGVAVDAEGNVFAAGYTASADFPVTEGAFQTAHAGGGASQDAFVAKLNSAGSGLAYSTFIGGAHADQAAAIAVAADGSAYVAGFTESFDFPTTPANCLTGYAGGRDAFVLKLDAAGASLGYSHFLGGRSSDAAEGIALGAGGAAVVTGTTGSANFTTTWDAMRSAYGEGHRGMTDAFLARIDEGQGPAPPCVALNGLVNGASFLPGPVAPGEIISVFGAGLGPPNLAVFDLAGGDRIAPELAGTRVLFDGVAAPIIATISGQVNAIVPYSVAGNDAVRVRVEYQGRPTAEMTVPVAPASPAIFLQNAAGQGAILNQDFSVNGPANRAARGSIIQIFATGEGQTDPPGVDGKVAGAILPSPVLPVKVTIGGREAVVHYAGAAPGLVAGVLQINAQVPDDVPAGSAVPIVIQVGDRRSPQGVTVAIR